MEDIVTSTVESINDDLKDRLFDAMPAAIDAAKSKAGDTAVRWGAHKSEGGLDWATYKAVCRRDGVFTGSGGLHNFNAQLLEPVMQRLAGPWEQIFTRRLPGALNGLPNSAGHVLTAFHNETEKRAIRNGSSIAAFQMLKQQIAVYRETLKAAMGETKGQVTEKQRDANRELEPRLQQAMLAAYQVCNDEVGKGQYNRMKVHMTGHVEQSKSMMFDQCINHVRSIITKMLKDVEEDLLDKTDKIYMAMEKEYTSIVLGETDRDFVLTREQRAIRKHLLEILDSAELMFKRAVGLEPYPDPEPEAAEATMTGTPENGRSIAGEATAAIKADPEDRALSLEAVPAAGQSGATAVVDSADGALAVKTEVLDDSAFTNGTTHALTTNADAAEDAKTAPQPTEDELLAASATSAGSADMEMEDVAARPLSSEL